MQKPDIMQYKSVHKYMTVNREIPGLKTPSRTNIICYTGQVIYISMHHSFTTHKMTA